MEVKSAVIEFSVKKRLAPMDIDNKIVNKTMKTELNYKDRQQIGGMTTLLMEQCNFCQRGKKIQNKQTVNCFKLSIGNLVFPLHLICWDPEL